MIKNILQLIFLIALGYLGLKIWAGGSVANPFSGSGLQMSAAVKSREISVGETFDMQQQAKKGSVTLFYFTAPWCGPCKVFNPELERYVQSRPGVCLRKINIQDWNSPVAKQYGIRSIPQIWIAAPSGQIVHRGVPGNIRQIAEFVRPIAPAHS